MDTEDKIQWHEGFFAGIEWELRKYKTDLVFDTEYQLSKKALEIDMLVIQKTEGIQIEVPFGKIFRKYNIIEYKSPDDGLTIDDFFKSIGYACLYKGLGTTVDAVPANELTVSLFRHRLPRELLRQVKIAGGEIEERGGGVYNIKGFFHIPIQIVVTRELPEKDWSALRMLAHRIDREDAETLLEKVGNCVDPGERHNLEAVLNVSVRANLELFQRIKEENTMSQQVLRMVFGPEYDIGMEKSRVAGKAEGREEGREEGMEYGIRAMVQLLQKRSASREETANELENLYNLSAEEAAAKVDLYWTDAAPENK